MSSPRPRSWADSLIALIERLPGPVWLDYLVLQRDVLARLPTWPWSTGTLRGFASVLVVPIVIWLIQRLLGNLI